MSNEWKLGLLHQVKFLDPDECVHCGKKLTTDYFYDLCEPRVKVRLASMAAELNQPASPIQSTQESILEPEVAK